MNAYLAEFTGTAILVTFGNGVVANVVLARTKGNKAGWIVITAGWGDCGVHRHLLRAAV
jgi:glycerol uptake facilitator protein